MAREHRAMKWTGDDTKETKEGTRKADKLSGLGADDALYGLNGNDKLFGGEDNDFLFGGNGDDLIKGDNHIDILLGEAGNDKIHGEEGNDNIMGGAGDDKLWGGIGGDKFNYNLAEGFPPIQKLGKDVVKDFSAGAGLEDVVQFSTKTFTSFAAVLEATTDSNKGATIKLSNKSSVTLAKVDKADLNPDDFAFLL